MPCRHHWQQQPTLHAGVRAQTGHCPVQSCACPVQPCACACAAGVQGISVQPESLYHPSPCDEPVLTVDQQPVVQSTCSRSPALACNHESRLYSEAPVEAPFQGGGGWGRRPAASWVSFLAPGGCACMCFAPGCAVLAALGLHTCGVAAAALSAGGCSIACCFFSRFMSGGASGVVWTAATRLAMMDCPRPSCNAWHCRRRLARANCTHSRRPAMFAASTYSAPHV